MGASGWSYYVPYQESVEQALVDLRQKIFKAGKYYKQNYIIDLNIENYFPPGYQVTDEQKIKIQEEIKNLEERNKLPVNTINDLLAKNAESGTHSIIDIRTIVETDDLYQSGKINDTDLIKLFSTLKPTKSQIQSKEMELQTYRGRWLCTYQIVYLNDEPQEYFFTGYSGD